MEAGQNDDAVDDLYDDIMAYYRIVEVHSLRKLFHLY